MTKYQHTKAYRERKKAKGICIMGGCWRRASTRRLQCLRHRRQDANRVRVYNHGLDAVEHFLVELKRQKGKCAICRTVLTYRPQQDHNHVTGRRRGVLCILCNVALERLETHATWEKQARKYLKKWA